MTTQIQQRRPIRYIRAIYDPEPRAIYDPDPDPFPIIEWVILGIVALAVYLNPNMINNLMYMLNPDLTKLAEEQVKAQRETIQAIVLIACLVSGILIFYWFYVKGKEKKRRRRKIR